MRTRPLPAAVAGVLGAALLLGGCSAGTDGGGADAATAGAAVATGTPSTDTSGTPTDDPSTDGAATGDAPTGSGSATDSGAGASGTVGSGEAGAAPSAGAAVDLTALGLQDRHPNGSSIQVTSLTVERTGIVVGVTVVNGYTDEISLNARGLYLQDDNGNGYNFREPAQNSALAVAPGAELVGELVFLGVLDPTATSLTLKGNVYDAQETIDLAARSSTSITPALLVGGIPVG